MFNKFMKKKYYTVLSAVFAAMVIFTLQIITKQVLFSANPYNSYMLQVQAWLEGRLDLGKDYPYLELAIYNSKYFVSFPPFPSYIMLPLAALGLYNCDTLIAFVSAIFGVIYSYKLAAEFINEKKALLLSMLATIGSNLLFVSVNAWVWFIAQNLAFTLTVAAFYYAKKGKAGVSLTLWACAVGCRPFQVIYIFVILFLLYGSYKEQNPADNIFNMIKKHMTAIIGAIIIAFSYMLLNYMRFGSVFEFGHNYLPEFTRVETGQFNLVYIKQNFGKLFRLPLIVDGKIEFQRADGFCMFIASPIIILFFVYWILTLKNAAKRDKLIYSLGMVLFWLHLIMITAHKTMGGAHYGNRYINDALPLVLLMIAGCSGRYKYFWLNIFPLMLGLILNFFWVIKFFV